MEQRTNVSGGDDAVFIIGVKPGELDRPVSGWAFGTEDERVEVLRHEGEADTDLEERAATLAREQTGRSCPLLFSVR